MKTTLFVLFAILCLGSFAQGKFYPILYTDTNKVHEHVETEVLYPGGQRALDEFVSKNVKYPETAKTQLIQGNVVLEADVDVRGQQSNARVVGSLHPDLDKEALRIVKAFPKLKPATISGKAVRALATFVIRFEHPDARTKKIPITQPKFEEKAEIVAISIKDDEQIVTENIAVPAPKRKVFYFVEQMPEFPNGESALLDTIIKNTVYPEQAIKDSVTGKVMIRFIVDENGNVIEPEVMRGASPALDKEALRVVSNLPKFIPGRQQGKAVSVYFNLPIVFKL